VAVWLAGRPPPRCFETRHWTAHVWRTHVRLTRIPNEVHDMVFSILLGRQTPKSLNTFQMHRACVRDMDMHPGKRH
jgi:hypothetical protein